MKFILIAFLTLMPQSNILNALFLHLNFYNPGFYTTSDGAIPEPVMILACVELRSPFKFQMSAPK